jgi:curli biogenesis system outer membrane secretion channel CsgG
MLRKTLLILAVLCTAILIGCSKTETTENSNTTAANSNKTATTATPATTAPVSAGEKIGVPECDDFIAKYDACVSSKVPEQARAQFKSAVDQWRASWKKLADNPATKGSLAAACKQAAEQQAAALKTYGCTF